MLNCVWNSWLQKDDVEHQNGKLPNGGLNERYHYILRTRAARVSSATTLCLLITALLVSLRLLQFMTLVLGVELYLTRKLFLQVMTVGLFGGLYIYKQMTRARVSDLPFCSLLPCC